MVSLSTASGESLHQAHDLAGTLANSRHTLGRSISRPVSAVPAQTRDRHDQEGPGYGYTTL